MTPTGEGGPTGRRWVMRSLVLCVVLVVGVLALALTLVNVFVVSNWADAMTYAEGARRIFAGISPYSAFQLTGPYPLDAAAYGEGFVYPPTGAYLLVPFVLGEPFWIMWNVVSIVATIGVFVLLVRRELGGLTPAWTLGAAAVGMVIFIPALNELKTGYLSPMLAVGVGTMWLWPRWSAIPALVFGLIKAFPAIGLIWTIRKRGAWKLPLVVAVGFGVVATLLHVTFLSEWFVALANAEAGCPSFALPSFGCLGVPVIGYVMAVVLAVAAWRVPQDDVSFLLLALAMTVPLPDLYWGNVMVPMMASVPLVIRLLRRVQLAPVSSPISHSASSIE
jgi:hypothetical protein